MLGCLKDQRSFTAGRDVKCHAKRQGRRGTQHGGASGHKHNGGKGSSRPPASTSAVPKMSAAAKAAAKRASMFSQQRFERALNTAAPDLLHTTDNSSTPSTYLQDSRQYSSTLKNSNALYRKGPGNGRTISNDTAATSTADDAEPSTVLQPYVQTVVEHLKQTGTLQGSSSSSRGRGSKRGAARTLLESHTAVFQAALDLELQDEWREAEERLQAWPATRLSSEGVALFNLAAAPAGGMFRDVLLKFFIPNKPLPFHSFAQGDILLVSRGDPLADSHESVVVDYSSRWIRLALNPTAAAAVAAAGRNAAWRLDLFANTVSHERCTVALQQFAAVAGGQQQQQQQGSGLTVQSVVQQQEVLWRVLAGVIPQGQTVSAAAAVPPPWLRSAQGRQRLAAARQQVKGLVAAGRLNGSQGKAVEAALTRTCTLWQGPPGTGKTTTLLRFCEAAVGLLAPCGGQVLAVAASNVAVDNLVAGLLGLGLKVVRLGQPVKVAPALRSVSLEVLAAATPAGQAAAKLRNQLVAAAAAARNTTSSSSSKRRSSSSSGGGGQAQWEQMLALEAAAAAEVLGSVQVVAATCVGAGDPVIADKGFEVVVLDEATQAPEPAALVAVAARAQALVMVGDPQQLPPTVKCRAAATLGLGVSLFDRLQSMGLQPLLLDVQYRMHPALCAFPAKQFYGGLLQSWPTTADRPLPQGVQWPNPQVPVMFVQCNGPERRTRASFSISRQRETGTSTDEDDGTSSSSSSSGNSAGGYSFYNDAEAAAVVRCLEQLLLQQDGVTAADVGVITPYSGQVRAIQQQLPQYAYSAGTDNSETDGLQRSNRRSGSSSSNSRKDSSSSSSKLTSAALTDLEVKSVDGFQGREKEVVIFSAVRSNASGKVGFLSDARRLNVALTRAKRGLIVVGDARTLRSDAVWSSWLRWAQKQGVIVEHLSF